MDVILKKIFDMGKDFSWTRPEKCPCCGNWKVWRHGFASTLFQGFDSPLLLKRYRCPACVCIIKLRPSISMDGKGRAFDNIFVERLWRSVKYEEVYLNDYEIVKNAIVGLFRYFEFYNKERVHQALEYQTPYEVYAKK